VPGVNRFAAREIVKDHINASQHFRQQDDLSGVHRIWEAESQSLPVEAIST
jgi:hypothetical protein